MSSADSDDLQSTLQLLQWSGYLSAAVMTAVIYDYVLVFPREVNYVWLRSWTVVSTLFVVVRYIGLSLVIILALGIPPFVSGTVKVSTALYLVAVWEGPIFFAAVDLIMILRVYAMWNQSKKILYFLLFIYVPHVITSFVLTGIFDDPNTYTPSTTIQVPSLNLSVCLLITNDATTEQAVHSAIAIPQLLFSITLLILAIIQTWRQSVDMYKATKQWKPNKYMQHLMKDGMLYFFVYVSTFFYFHSVPFSFITDLTVKYLQRLTTLIPRYVFLSINIMNGNLATANNTISGPTLMVSLVLVVSMMSRFVISMRELYDRDIHGRWEGIDSAFGRRSGSGGQCRPRRGNSTDGPRRCGRWDTPGGIG
ncbi:hypothetical protein V8E55_008259 [Tylopilus felleus]